MVPEFPAYACSGDAHQPRAELVFVTMSQAWRFPIDFNCNIVEPAIQYSLMHLLSNVLYVRM
jgi:hypothetical protein